jgi:hypothetical protein
VLDTLTLTSPLRSPLRSFSLPHSPQEITGGVGCAAVFDGVGKTTYKASLACVGRRGVVVFFGNASGPVPPIAPLELVAKSAFITRPKLLDYTVTRAELDARAYVRASAPTSHGPNLHCSPIHKHVRAELDAKAYARRSKCHHYTALLIHTRHAHTRTPTHAHSQSRTSPPSSSHVPHVPPPPPPCTHSRTHTHTT